MSLIKKCSYLHDIRDDSDRTTKRRICLFGFHFKFPTNSRIDNAMPYFWLYNFLIIIGCNSVSSCLLVIEELLINKVYIRIDTWKLIYSCIYHWYSYIPNENSSNETRYDSLLSITLIIEFFILCCDDSRRYIFFNDKYRCPRRSECPLYILSITIDF